MRKRQAIYSLVLLLAIFPGKGKSQSSLTLSEIRPTNGTASCANAPVPSNNSLPIGPYCAVITGNGFSAGIQVTIGQRSVVVLSIDSPTQMTIAGAGLVAWDGTYQQVVASAGPLRSAPIRVLVGTPNAKVSWAAASRFLEQATFGPNYSGVVHLQSVGMNQWLLEQFRWKQTAPYTATIPDYNYYAAKFFSNATNAPDQLRQKVAFALTQLFVVSALKLNSPQLTAPYNNMLYQMAFMNYPAILKNVTLSPAMGIYLDMAGNKRAANGYQPNQNYAREVLQLMSIGTVLMDITGQPTLIEGRTVPTYTETTIANFARVFTGWTLEQSTVDYMLNYSLPMLPNNADHDGDISISPKVLLGVAGKTLPFETTTNGDAATELDQALRNITSHPNVAPFISKFLIQHLVTSNPSPSYVGRIATIFADTGGDMQSVIKAILLDKEARAGDSSFEANPNFGHLKEPALWLSSIARALGYPVADPDSGAPYNVLYPFSTEIGQNIFYEPSVFNFYSPAFQLPPSLGQPSGLLGPEFQLFSTATAYLRMYTLRGSQITGNDWYAAYPATNLYANLATAPDLLLDALDATMTGGQMPTAMKTLIVSRLPNIQASPYQPASLGAFLIAISPIFQVTH